MKLVHVAEGCGPTGGKVIAINTEHILAVYPQGNGCNRIVFDARIEMVAEGGQLSVTDPIEHFIG